MSPSTPLACLLAARRCELRDLCDLTETVRLVAAITSYVHHLQSERGLSSLFLARPDPQAEACRQAQTRGTDEAQAELMRWIRGIDGEAAARYGARLFSQLALALQGLDALPALRVQVSDRVFDVWQSTQAYSQIVRAWMTVVFEAADVATDADVSRQLVALFNLSNVKEQVGQERALGSALFAGGQIDVEGRQQMQDLIDSQERGLESFLYFAGTPMQQRLEQMRNGARPDERTRLRRLLLEESVHGALNPLLGRPWFEACTEHMDLLKALEMELLRELDELCRHKAGLLRTAIEGLEELERQAPDPTAPMQALLKLHTSGSAPVETDDQAARRTSRLETAGPAAMGPELSRHVMELVLHQGRRLQAVTAELDEARASLQDRKLVERAKGLLMAQAALSEEEAYQALRKRAMQQGRRMAEVAQALLRRTN